MPSTYTLPLSGSRMALKCLASVIYHSRLHQHRHELPALYLHGYAVQRIDRLLGIVAELQIFSS